MSHKFETTCTFISPWKLKTTQKLNFDIGSESWINLICFIDSKLYLNTDIQLSGSDFLGSVRWSGRYVAYCEVHMSNAQFFFGFFVMAIACVQQSLQWHICQGLTVVHRIVLNLNLVFSDQQKHVSRKSGAGLFSAGRKIHPSSIQNTSIIHRCSSLCPRYLSPQQWLVGIQYVAMWL